MKTPIQIDNLRKQETALLLNNAQKVIPVDATAINNSYTDKP